MKLGKQLEFNDIMTPISGKQYSFHTTTNNNGNTHVHVTHTKSTTYTHTTWLSKGMQPCNKLNSHTLLVNNTHSYHNKSNMVYACLCNLVKVTLIHTIHGTRIEMKRQQWTCVYTNNGLFMFICNSQTHYNKIESIKLYTTTSPQFVFRPQKPAMCKQQHPTMFINNLSYHNLRIFRFMYITQKTEH